MPNDKATEEALPKEEGLSRGEELPASEEFSSEADLKTKIEMAGADVRVSPFDPDFLIFALPFAFAIDILDIILEIAGLVVVVPKIVGIVIDFLTLTILGGWLYWRTGKIAKSKKDYQAKLKEAVQKGIKRLSKAQKLGQVSPQVFDRYMRLYGKQMGKVGRAAARTATKPLTRTLVRAGLAFLGEIIIIIGLIPCWTIMVILSLREK